MNNLNKVKELFKENKEVSLELLSKVLNILVVNVDFELDGEFDPCLKIKYSVLIENNEESKNNENGPKENELDYSDDILEGMLLLNIYELIFLYINFFQKTYGYKINIYQPIEGIFKEANEIFLKNKCVLANIN
jgi:hypothetical protein